MNKILLGIVAAACATSAQAVVNVDFGSDPGNLGDDHDYVTSVGTITASGYTDDFVDGELYGKNLGGDEQGLGLVDDPSGQNEIYGGFLSSGNGAFVQLDVSDILASTSMAQFFMNSTTSGESWFVIGSNTDACGWVCGDLVATGSDEGALHTLLGWGNYQFYDFYSSNGNVLLGGLTLTESVPEPATWAMMLLGFGAMGVAFRRAKRKVTLPQLA
jgi:hypothetical protein